MCVLLLPFWPGARCCCVRFTSTASDLLLLALPCRLGLAEYEGMEAFRRYNPANPGSQYSWAQPAVGAAPAGGLGSGHADVAGPEAGSARPRQASVGQAGDD